MREIKFRAWSKGINGFLEITMLEVIKGEITGIWHAGDYIGYDKEDIHLMQYTGLKDKNLREIYEGDILHNENYQIDFIVYWDDGVAGFYANVYGDIESLEENIDRSTFYIGNIYENPELLEE